MSKNKKIIQVGFLVLIVGVTSLASLGIPIAHADTNIIPNPSLEVPGTNGLPQQWAKGRWGDNTAVYTYPVVGNLSDKAAKVEITQYVSGDVKWWFQETPIVSQQAYHFTNDYTATTPSYLTAQYRLVDGTLKYADLAVLPVSPTWRTTAVDFVTPANAVKISIFHLIKGVGSLTVDNYTLARRITPQTIVSLNIDDGVKTAYQNTMPILNSAGMKATYYIITKRFDFPGYMNVNEVLAAQAAGHEIGAHTRTHPDLTTLTPEQIRDEVIGSVEDLRAIGVRSVDTFAYPYGAYNAATRAITDTAGFRGVRVSNGGYNNLNSNKLLLNRQGLENTTTLAQVQGWVDSAIQNKSWLILVFHHIDSTGEQYSITPELFRQITDYLTLKGVKVRTTRDALTEYFE